MRIETSQTFYDRRRDVELSAEAVVLLRGRQSLVETGKAANSCRAWINASSLVCTVSLPSDTAILWLSNLHGAFQEEWDLKFCVYFILTLKNTHTVQNLPNQSSESSWRRLFAYCKEIKSIT